MFRRSLLLTHCALVLIACRNGTEPVLHDFDLARQRWLGDKPAEYQFETALATSWFPKSAFLTAVVRNDSVISVFDATGVPVKQSWVISIDALWSRVINERAKGGLNSVVFSLGGVPLESDWGPWPSDGGVHYSVRHFVRKR